METELRLIDQLRVGPRLLQAVELERGGADERRAVRLGEQQRVEDGEGIS
jgi:hypothetical protein